MKGVILSAGFGTRMQPLSNLLPKPLLPVANAPLAEHLIRFLARYGITEIAMNLHHLAELVPRALGDGSRYGVRLTYSFEKEILGTAGGIARLRDFVSEEESLLVVNGDCLQGFDLGAMLEAVQRQQRSQQRSGAVLLVRPDPLGHYTALAADAQGRLLEIGGAAAEKAEDRLMFAGLQVISGRLLERLPERGDLVGDFYQPLLAQGEERLTVFRDAGLWEDLGNPLRYLEGSLAGLSFWAGRGDSSWIWNGAQADSDPARRFLLGPGAVLAPGARVREAILGSGAHIASGARVARSILWANSEVGPWASLDHVVVAGARVPAAARIENACVLPGATQDEILIVPFAAPQ